MNQFSIKDVESLTGIKPHTLRIWEQRYGIPQPKRTSSNIRTYDDKDIRLLLNVSLLNRRGVKISKIAKMSETEMSDFVIEYSEEENDKAVQIEILVAALFRLDEVNFEKILASNFLQLGFEKTYLEIIFPFLNKVGLLWQTGGINPAYEHFITNLIRQKLFVAIDNQTININEKNKKFLLFLPANEPHEIGLLFANYIIRSRGHQTSYLGPNLPIADLKRVMNVYKADYILTVLTASISSISPLTIANKLANEFPSTKILMSGPMVMQAHIQFPKNVKLVHTFEELDRLLIQL